MQTCVTKRITIWFSWENENQESSLDVYWYRTHYFFLSGSKHEFRHIVVAIWLLAFMKLLIYSNSEKFTETRNVHNTLIYILNTCNEWNTNLLQTRPQQCFLIGQRLFSFKVVWSLLWLFFYSVFLFPVTWSSFSLRSTLFFFNLYTCLLSLFNDIITGNP